MTQSVRLPRVLLLTLLAGTAFTPIGRALAQDAAVNAGTVSATGNGVPGGNGNLVPGASAPSTQQQIFESGQTTRVLDQSYQQLVGPMAGVAQVLQFTPGAVVNSYGNTGMSKATIGLDGLYQGWGGFGGYTGNNTLMLEMDGIPLNNVATGLANTAQLPQMQMFQTEVTYGPGEAKDRWYDSLGGTINFVPVQPTKTMGGDVFASAGSFNTQNIYFDLRSGTYNGWSAVLAGGAGQGDSFRTSVDGFNNPGTDYSLYGKVIKSFSTGDVSFGGYFGRAAEYRPNVIPTSPQAGIGLGGQNAAGGAIGPLYSQQTSGYYSSLPFDTWNKFDVDQTWLVYAKQNLQLDDYVDLHNVLWYRDGERLHDKFYNYVPALQNTGGIYEYNNPSSQTFGDKVDLTFKLPMNNVDVGGYYIYSKYNTQNSFWNPFLPLGTTNIMGSQAAPNANYRSDYFVYNDLALFLQDDFHPIQGLHITPGIRFVDFNAQYTMGAQQAFPLAFQYNPGGNQGLRAGIYANQQNRTGIEPSLDVNYEITPWFSVYGSYDEAYGAPNVGGGGGLFQKVDPTYYGLVLSQEAQIGFKAHVDNKPQYFLNNFLMQINYFHTRLADQEINVGVGNAGNFITAKGTSIYQGMNLYFEDKPIYNIHTFLDAAYIDSYYQSYNTQNVPGATGGFNYNKLPVPYVPNVTLNIGADYAFNVYDKAVVTPTLWYSYTGSQSIFNNLTGAPSKQTMPGYGTINMSLDTKVPLQVLGKTRTVDLNLALLNMGGGKYNTYEYISSGGYFNTANGGYALAYPGAPFTAYGSIGISF